MTSDFARQAYGSFARLRPGSRIAGYLIEEQIGAGGMAVVFRARDEALGRLAAVKVIAPSMSNDEEFRVRFLRESRAAAAVRSLHIVPVFGAGQDQGLLYIATQFVAGGDLAGLLHRSGGRLAPERVVALVSQVASALDAAHAAGLVHRDVKPGNILIDIVPERAEHAYLADFGLSKTTAAQSATSLTATGQFVGTPDYCAPEQVMGLRVDGRADQYALGCVAFALLTGRPPFRRQETMGILFAQLNEPVPPVTGLRPELPPAVDDIIAEAMAKSPMSRYETCGEFAAALREALAPARSALVSGTRTWRQAPGGPSGLSGARLPAGDPSVFARSPSAQPAGTGGTVGSGEPVWHPGTVRTENGAGRVNRRRNATRDHGRRRRKIPGLRKVTVIWAAAGAAVLLAAGVTTAVLLHSSPPSVGPRSVAVSGSVAWITNMVNNSVTVFDLGTPANSGTLKGPVYGFDYPDAVATDSRYVWVANQGDNSVTQLNASMGGAFIRTLKGASYGFNDPVDIADDGTHIWVANLISDSVTELNADDGSLVRTMADSSYGFNQPLNIVSDGTRVWVFNENGGGFLTELNASNGTLIRTLKTSSYGLVSVDRILSDGTHVWIAGTTSGNEDLMGELNDSNGALTHVLKQPMGVLSSAVIVGSHIWVNGYSPNGEITDTELNASDGSQIRTVTLEGVTQGGNIAADSTHILIIGPDDSITELNASNGALVGTVKN